MYLWIDNIHIYMCVYYIYIHMCSGSRTCGEIGCPKFRHTQLAWKRRGDQIRKLPEGAERKSENIRDIGWGPQSIAFS